MSEKSGRLAGVMVLVSLACFLGSIIAQRVACVAPMKWQLLRDGWLEKQKEKENKREALPGRPRWAVVLSASAALAGGGGAGQRLRCARRSQFANRDQPLRFVPSFAGAPPSDEGSGFGRRPGAPPAGQLERSTRRLHNSSRMTYYPAIYPHLLTHTHTQQI